VKAGVRRPESRGSAAENGIAAGQRFEPPERSLNPGTLCATPKHTPFHDRRLRGKKRYFYLWARCVCWVPVWLPWRRALLRSRVRICRALFRVGRRAQRDDEPDIENTSINGWNIGGGGQWRPAPGPFSLRGDLRYSRSMHHQVASTKDSGRESDKSDHGLGCSCYLRSDGVFDIYARGGVKEYLMAVGWRLFAHQTSHPPPDADSRIRRGNMDGWAGFCITAGFSGRCTRSA